MKYFYLYIFIFCVFICFMSYCNTLNSIERFVTQKTYVLMGDSILKNDAYVTDGASVESFIKKINPRTYSFAEDDSRLSDVFIQVDKLPFELNNPNTYIFLSAGGNNIILKYFVNSCLPTNTNLLISMFDSYKNLIKSVQTRLPEAKLCLLDIYYPNSLQYKQFYSIIKEWNNMIYDFSENPKNNIYTVIKISNYLTQDQDFSFDIEPSTTGGKKIANLIVSI